MGEAEVKICELLKQKNVKGLECLFDRYYKPLVVWAATFLHDVSLAEDIVQDFFIKLWKRNFSENLLPGTLKSYLYISVRNLAINSLMKVDPLKRACDVAYYEEPWEEYSDFEEEVIRKVEDALGKLPTRSQEIVRCVYLKGMSYKEVALELDISVSTVNTLLVNAMRKLRRTLDGEKSIFIYLLLVFHSIPGNYLNHKKIM